MTTLNSHVLKATADERIADLRREATPRAERTRGPKSRRRRVRPVKPIQTLPVARPEQR